jgi:hypothetical protein
MQVHTTEEEEEREKNPEDYTVEDFIFMSFCKPGLGQVCEYCQIQTGYSLKFLSFSSYIDHWFNSHWDGKISSSNPSLYAFPEDLEKACKKQRGDYKKRLRQWQKEHIQYGITWLAWK